MSFQGTEQRSPAHYCAPLIAHFLLTQIADDEDDSVWDARPGCCKVMALFTANIWDVCVKVSRFCTWQGQEVLDELCQCARGLAHGWYCGLVKACKLVTVNFKRIWMHTRMCLEVGSCTDL